MDPGAKILLVDGNIQNRRWLQAFLERKGHSVLVAGSGEQAQQVLAGQPADVALIELALPDMDGLELTRRIREQTTTAVIVLSTDDDETRKVTALEQGAEDCVTRPFGAEELLARIRAVLRRTRPGQSSSSAFVAGDLSIQFERRDVRMRGEPLKLTPTEYELLRQLVVNAGKVLTQRMLLSAVWGQGYSAQPQYLRMYIKRLRTKLEPDPANPSFILTEPGVGYWLSPEGLRAGRDESEQRMASVG